MNKRNYVSDEREKEKLFLQMEESLKQAIANADSGSADYYYLKGEHLHIYDKQYDSAILSYEKVVSIVPMRSKLYASATYALASCYLKKDDLENYEQWLTRAAISDILTPLKENFALQELSMYLFQKDNSNVAIKLVAVFDPLSYLPERPIYHPPHAIITHLTITPCLFLYHLQMI